MGAKGKVRGVFKSIKYFHINFVIKMFGVFPPSLYKAIRVHYSPLLLLNG